MPDRTQYARANQDLQEDDQNIQEQMLLPLSCSLKVGLGSESGGAFGKWFALTCDPGVVFQIRD